LLKTTFQKKEEKSQATPDRWVILGHKTMTMTLRYAHLSQEGKRKAVNLLNGLTASNSPANSPCHKSVTSCESQVSAVINAGLPTKKGVNRIG
jgi:hypothetical protein